LTANPRDGHQIGVRAKGVIKMLDRPSGPVEQRAIPRSLLW
jgi:hypothetical protein